jgi:hypothetical protein
MIKRLFLALLALVLAVPAAAARPALTGRR